MTLQLRIRNLGVWLAQALGTRIIDQRTGNVVGRAFIIPWRGKVHVIGLETPVRLIWVPQKRVTYWKQEIGFTTHPPPDYPNERSTTAEDRGERNTD